MVELPVGGAIRKKASAESRQADMARVSQLADVLGMSGAEVMGVQSEMMETAYKAQVQDALRTGEMRRDRRVTWPARHACDVVDETLRNVVALRGKKKGREDRG